MGRRGDSAPKTPGMIGLRLDVTEATRDKLRLLAARKGYSMSSYLRLLVECHAKSPGKSFDEIPKNPGKTT